MLDVQPVQRVGVVGGPHLVGAGEDAGAEPGPAAAAGLDAQVRVGGTEPVDDGVQVMDVVGPQGVGVALGVGPAGLGEGAVEVPLACARSGNACGKTVILP